MKAQASPAAGAEAAGMSNGSSGVDPVRPRSGAMRGSVAGGLHAAADAIAEASQRLWSARRIPEGVADAGQDVADGIESSAAYLDSHDASRIAADAVELARRYPVQTMLMVGAVGFIAGWLVRASMRRSQPRTPATSHRRRRPARTH
jgi:hypothetical protein